MDRIINDVCIIPDSFFDTYTEKRTEQETLLWYLESGKVEQKRHFAAMEEKMDELICVLKNNNVYAEISAKLDVLTKSISKNSTLVVDDQSNAEDMRSARQLKKNISRVKNLQGKFLRAEKMATYSDELLSMDPPYVQRKFRVKVSYDTPTEEIEIYENQSIHRARMETTLLKIRMKRWEKEIADLQQEIKLAFEDPKMKKAEKSNFEEQVKKNEDVNMRKSLKAFKRVQRTCDNELNSGNTQFLLKFTEDKPFASGGWGNGRRSSSRDRFQHNQHRKTAPHHD